MRQEISFEERKRIQLDMLDVIDDFCRKNGIRYSIAFGTLLGAVRHKGFIPWDDDVDIMMPLPDLLKFKASFKSDKYKYIDVDLDRTYAFDFSRVAAINTYNQEGPVSKSYGVCIDVYVLVGLPANIDDYFAKVSRITNIRLKMVRLRRALVSRLPIKNIPFYSYIQKLNRDTFFNEAISYQEAVKYYIIAGPLNIKEKMTYDRDLFKEICELSFEDRTYCAISDWDYFLTLRYGNYMQLPPEDQRHPYHGGHYYWKE